MTNQNQRDEVKVELRENVLGKGTSAKALRQKYLEC